MPLQQKGLWANSQCFCLLQLLVIPLMRKQRLKILNKVMPPELQSKPVKVEKAQALSLHLNCLLPSSDGLNIGWTLQPIFAKEKIRGEGQEGRVIFFFFFFFWEWLSKGATLYPSLAWVLALHSEAFSPMGWPRFTLCSASCTNSVAQLHDHYFG